MGAIERKINRDVIKKYIFRKMRLVKLDET